MASPHCLNTYPSMKRRITRAASLAPAPDSFLLPPPALTLTGSSPGYGEIERQITSCRMVGVIDIDGPPDLEAFRAREQAVRGGHALSVPALLRMSAWHFKTTERL